MVAIGGIGWSLAPSLKAYVDEADAAYPGRDHSSDGSIGDQAHASRTSDHNPYDGWVHAVDLDEDLAPGLDLKDFAKRLLKSRDPRIRYVIYEGQIFKSYVSATGPAWTWLPYTGPNSHSHHLHLSINRTATARNDMRPWGIKPPATSTSEEDDDMPAQPFALWRLDGGTRVYIVSADMQHAVHVVDPDDLQAAQDLLALGGFPREVVVAKRPAEPGDSDFYGLISRIIAASG